MWKRINPKKTGFAAPDVLAFAFLVGGFAAMITVARYWSSPLQPPEPIDLSFSSLPYAVFLSLSRIVFAYIVCLFSSIAIGYWAAHSKLAEKIIVPLIDIGQSVPALGYLPGLVLFFLSIFPDSRIGLEIAAILTLYTGMAWNLMLSFYSSIKTIPREYLDTIKAYGYGRLGIFFRLELPYSMNDVIWNSMLSVAGGWFFLTVCESYTFGDKSFSLLGLGSYMSVAAEKGDVQAILAGGITMILILVLTDFLIWKPLLRWAERFRKVTTSEEDEDEPVLNFFAKSKRITNFIRKMRRRYAVNFYVNQSRRKKTKTKIQWVYLGYFVFTAFVLLSFFSVYVGFQMFLHISLDRWIELLIGAAFTLMRVFFVLILSGLIMVPLGLYLGTKPKLIKRLQPVIQVLAAFPAPMLFPPLMVLFLWFSIPIEIGSVIFMMTGAQWYLLFNVIAGAASVPEKYVDYARGIGMSNWEIVRRVFLPAAFPQIVTGFITAAGGAWNTSIVAEIVVFRKQEYIAKGLGSHIAIVANNGLYSELVAAIAVMVFVVVMLNRTLWAYFFDLAETKYRMDT
ncbi:MAG: ABC transporter permease subunit [Oligoflexia bacterium]|nr:ABC transporter permease subunit [Oligoflexia bacterium]